MNDNLNRQNQRSKQAITDAFIQLIREKGYSPITVSEISEEANVGRTTFYRHFQNKAQILVGFHKSRFEKLNLAPVSREAWLEEVIPEVVIKFLASRESQKGFYSMLFSFGMDFIYLRNMIEDVLALHFEERLCRAFCQDELKIPIPVLARSMAGTFSWMIRWWSQDSPDYSPAEMASYMYGLIYSMLKDALLSDRIDNSFQ